MSAASFDRRLTAARADLAAEHLRGLVDAPRYAEGRGMRIIAPSAPLRRSPQADAPLETEALYGETVTVYDESEGWAWAQLERSPQGQVSTYASVAPDFFENLVRETAHRPAAAELPSGAAPDST